jgi:ribosomal protein S18 acetylase RimI-like enzyme
MKPALRAATVADLAFTRRLYLANMQAVTGGLQAWDEGLQWQRFDARFLASEVSIVCLDGQDVGWMQIEENAGEMFLKQFYIEQPFQRRGIGTGLLRDLLARAARARKRVTLSVVATNPARALYERLGFQVMGRDQYKLHMAKAPADAEA